jgi:hypothetical protein
MTDEEAEEDGPAVELGEGEPVEGAPLARVVSRLTWPQEKTGIEHKEGDTVVRTPDGPRELADVMADVDDTYFDRRQSFVDAVREVIGDGPVPTADSDSESA